ncbi:hypothetical protein [Paenibacillus sp. NPDC058071]|uniref:hypothetical protein n=1 Tax=Paenibacillus sp. NPDC058071 TaxID=3346326 RepID=UPI0036DE538B
MKIYKSDQVPPHMYTRAKLRKMGFKPKSKHIAYLTFPPNKRKYRLYSMDSVEPRNPQMGFSLLQVVDSPQAKAKFEEIRRRFITE